MAIKAARVEQGATEQRMSRKELLEKAEEYRRMADEQESVDFQACVEEIRSIVTEKHGFTIERVVEALTPRAGKAPATGERKTRSPKVKYAGPDGETWTGQGKMAGWLKKRQDAGEDISQFLVKEAA